MIIEFNVWKFVGVKFFFVVVMFGGGRGFMGGGGGMLCVVGCVMMRIGVVNGGI